MESNAAAQNDTRNGELPTESAECAATNLSYETLIAEMSNMMETNQSLIKFHKMYTKSCYVSVYESQTNNHICLDHCEVVSLFMGRTRSLLAHVKKRLGIEMPELERPVTDENLATYLRSQIPVLTNFQNTLDAMTDFKDLDMPFEGATAASLKQAMKLAAIENIKKWVQALQTIHCTLLQLQNAANTQ